MPKIIGSLITSEFEPKKIHQKNALFVHYEQRVNSHKLEKIFVVHTIIKKR